MGFAERRRFMVAMGVMLAAPLAEARPPAGRFRIGLLIAGGGPFVDANFIRPVLAGLRDLDYVPGENLTADVRTGHPDKLAALADELIALKPSL